MIRWGEAEDLHSASAIRIRVENFGVEDPELLGRVVEAKTYELGDELTYGRIPFGLASKISRAPRPL